MAITVVLLIITTGSTDCQCLWLQDASPAKSHPYQLGIAYNPQWHQLLYRRVRYQNLLCAFEEYDDPDHDYVSTSKWVSVKSPNLSDQTEQYLCLLFK